MNHDAFVARREADWRRLESMLDRLGSDPIALSEEGIGELGQLYRRATSDLALAQRDFAGRPVAVYLNQLVARSHAQIYRGSPGTWRQVRRFFLPDREATARDYRLRLDSWSVDDAAPDRSFPALYRKLLPYTAAAWLLFLIPAILAFLAVWREPELIVALLGPGVRDMVRQVERGEMWTEIVPSVRSAASAAILTNNIQVTFLAFAGGATGGLLTLALMVLNGVSIGAVFGLLHAHGMSPLLAEFVSAHGPVELSVVFVAGGCGLYVGDGLLRPGLSARRIVFARRADESVRVILGCVPLLIVAGLIEGFVSPSGLHWAIKLAVGLATGLALHAYWLRAGRP